MKLSDFPQVPYIKCVLKGQPGRAKTTAGFSFPQPMRVYDFDEKIIGPRNWLAAHNISLDGIDIIRPSDWHYDWMELDSELNSYRKNPGKYKSFGFDSYTAIADFLLGYTSDRKRAEGKAKQTGGIQVAGIDEYNAETSGLMDMLLFMKQVQAHVWMTAHVLETQSQQITDQGPKTIVSRMIATGGKKAAAKIPAYFPEVYAINVESKSIKGSDNNFNYYAYTRTLGEDDARTEFNLPLKLDFTDKPFFDTLMKAIAGK